MGVRYTEEQSACVNCLVGPVDVSAGAGSGKTFTLTQRIAHALEDPTSGVDDVDQICAITFTKKAAAELKGRVRSTLRANGMFDQALKVDGAWISTIHGMCSRILRAQALELGIDPAFIVISDGQRAEILDGCIDQILIADKADQHRYRELGRQFRVDSQGYGMSITQLVESILDAALGLDGGPLALQRAQGDAADMSVLARELVVAYQDLRPAWEIGKPGKQQEEALSYIDAGLAALEGFLQGEDKTPESLMKALDHCKLVRKLRGDRAEASEDYLSVHYRVIRQAVMAQSGALLEDALALSAQVDEVFSQKKRELAVFDNNDLLVYTARALDIPEVAARYEDLFRLVMVDEFQDTDQLQLRIIRHLAGPGMRYLCTVGDAQQSIYGFRGADIAVYRRYQASLDDPALAAAGGAPAKLMLSRNFRSHGDVLAFVRAVCSQPAVFGDGFLDLQATYDGAKYRGTLPRTMLSVCLAAPGKGDGTSIADARAVQAGEIARYFARMHRDGHALSEMVLLLGTTSQASTYAQAIREQVGPCVIAGGSLFSKALEVQIVNALLQVIVNPRDTASLFAVLSSEVFALCADDFLTLTTDAEGDYPARRSLDKGLQQLGWEARQGYTLSGCSEALAHAITVLAKSQQALPATPIDQVLLAVLRDSGWLMRLQASGAEGLARCGNVMKAVRLVKQLQEENLCGPAWVAGAFASELDSLKEAPGALNAGGQEAVRIMTIHASKGLEFPIVALADFDPSARSSSFCSRKVEGQPCVSIKVTPGKIAGQDQVAKAFCAVEVDEDMTVSALTQAPTDVFHAYLEAAAQAADAAERQRLFYVGATRAKEALCVFLAAKPSTSGDYLPEKGLAADIKNAFFPGEPYPASNAEIEIGASQPVLYQLAMASGTPVDASDEAEDGKEETVGMLVPQVAPFVPLSSTVPEPEDTGLYSYSSLSHAGLERDLALGEVSLDDLEADSERVSADRVRNLSVKLAAYDEMDDPDTEGAPRRQRAEDDDKATDFGSAFHRLGQLAALAGPEVARDRLPFVQRTYGVSDPRRLRTALETWLGSAECARALACRRHQPELSFALQLPTGVLEGEIDLLCDDGDKEFALVIDYKTGGTSDETLEDLRKKHGLQAQCYAAAVLSAGYASVDLAFCRVERGDAITFSYGRDDLPQLVSQLSDRLTIS